MTPVSLLPEPSLQTQPKSTYLPHLDGFRFIALLGVLLFHFEVPAAIGGFIGVDCFLVLSGFLITRNILRSAKHNTFSLRDFYVRRFWRLYPSSLAVTFATAIFAVLVFPTDLAKPTLSSALSSASLISNIHFFKIADYFDDGADLKPLLHTWSLSLEEQFYFFWPILLSTFTLKCPNRPVALPLALALVSCGSVALSYALQKEHPSFVFFMLPTRVYEFGLGALCALTEPTWKAHAKANFFRITFETFMSLASLVVICGSYFAMPQVVAPHHVLPVLLSTAVLIMTPNSLLCFYVLSTKVLRVLGSLTYTAYLTHWPIFVFSKYVSNALGHATPGPIAMTIATFSSAWVLQSFVEDPLRHKRMRYIRSFSAALVSFFVVCLVVLLAFAKGHNFNGENAIHQDFRDRCIDYEPELGAINLSYGCDVGDPNGRPSNVTITGDSYARHLIPAYDVYGKKKGLKFSFVWLNSCQLMPYGSEENKKRRQQCLTFEENRWRLLKGFPVKGTKAMPANGTLVLAGFPLRSSLEEQKKRIVDLRFALTKLGYKMVISGPPPGVPGEDRWRLACLDMENTIMMRIMRSIHPRFRTSCASGWMGSRWSQKPWRVDFKDMFPTTPRGIMYIDVIREICKEENDDVLCPVLWNGGEEGDRHAELGYLRDGHHLATAGSEYLIRVLEKVWSFGE